MTPNLIGHPFSILSLSCDASNQQIIEAFEDCSSDQTIDDSVLRIARQSLLTPKLRLKAELSYFLDTPAGQIANILTVLRNANPDFTSLFISCSRLAPLSRSNLISHLATHGQHSADLIVALVQAQSQVEPSDIHQATCRCRETAKVVSPDIKAVQRELSLLADQQTQWLFDSYPSPERAALDMKSATLRLLAIGSACSEQLDTLLSSYWRSVSRETSLLRAAIEAAANLLRASPTDNQAASDLELRLTQWCKFNQPLAIVEKSKGRADAEATALMEQVRSLSIDLANDLSAPDIALRLTKLSLDRFLLQPRIREKLEADVTALADLTLDANCQPLLAAAMDASSDLIRYAKSQKSGSVADAAQTDLIKRLITTVESVGPAVDAPWLIARGVSIALFNDANLLNEARCLSLTLLALAEEKSASADVIAKLREDVGALEKHRRESVLTTLWQSGQWAAASSMARHLAGQQTTDEARRKYRAIQARATHKRVFQIASRVVGGIVATMIFIGIMNNGSPRGQKSGQVSPDYPTALTRRNTASLARPDPPRPEPARRPPVHSAVLMEIKPDELTLDERTRAGPIITRSNIRYCMFQEYRLEQTRPLLNQLDLANEFDAAINDWNSRCSAYRYMEQDKQAVMSELPIQVAALRVEAEQIAMNWRKQRVSAQARRQTPSDSLTAAPSSPAVSSPAVASILEDELTSPPSTPEVTGSIVQEDADGAFEKAVSGLWADRLADCPGSKVRTSGIPIRITNENATAGQSICSFEEKKSRSENTWIIKASCRARSNSWTSNIQLERIENQLKWSSERGKATYTRCPS